MLTFVHVVDGRLWDGICRLTVGDVVGDLVGDGGRGFRRAQWIVIDVWRVALGLVSVVVAAGLDVFDAQWPNCDERMCFLPVGLRECCLEQGDVVLSVELDGLDVAYIPSAPVRQWPLWLLTRTLPGRRTALGGRGRTGSELELAMSSIQREVSLGIVVRKRALSYNCRISRPFEGQVAADYADCILFRILFRILFQISNLKYHPIPVSCSSPLLSLIILPP